jgi:hypothetical protein
MGCSESSIEVAVSDDGPAFNAQMEERQSMNNVGRVNIKSGDSKGLVYRRNRTFLPYKSVDGLYQTMVS